MENQYIQWANSEEFVEVKGKTTGQPFALRKFVYGVLVPDPTHPLSCVSVANSSLSIDLWTGCAFQCVYCHVQGTLEDLIDEGKMARKPLRRNRFGIHEIVDALAEHPFFVPHETVISIGTASTEPFAAGEVTESTFQIMDAFVRRGLRNPFWIVTKAGFPKGRKQDTARILRTSRGLMLSVCWADNPTNIEPATNNRFRYIAEAKEAGVTTSWYLRPIVPEWSGSPERIEMMMLWVADRYGSFVDAIVPGGLRWTEGIENGLVEIHQLPMPEIPRDDNVKCLPDDIWELIFSLGERYFPGVPIYRRSSCALSYMLSAPSLTMVQIAARQDCEGSQCPARQRGICSTASCHSFNTTHAQRRLDRLGIPVRVRAIQNGQIDTDPPLETFTYAIRQTVLKELAREEDEGNGSSA